MSTITPTELKTSLADPGWIPWPLYRLTLDQEEIRCQFVILARKDETTPDDAKR